MSFWSVTGKNITNQKKRMLMICIDKKNWKIWVAVAKGAGILTVTVLLFALSTFLTDSNSSSVAHPAQTLEQRFPDAPDTYGLLPPDSLPEIPNDVLRLPAFSWIGKKDVSDLKYVASREGRHFYPKEDPVAALITLEHFVGYKTVEDAYADSKIPAPPEPK